jgi:glutaminyl-tRNA synthetase
LLELWFGRQIWWKTNLRFDDTNPVTEDTEYVESIKADVRWLGFDWENELYASDYFDQLYELAVQLIKRDWRM